MSIPSLKSWKLDHGVYTSPRFSEVSAFNRAKRFFIRAQIKMHCDERGRIIKIPTSQKEAPGNMEQLKKLKLI